MLWTHITEVLVNAKVPVYLLSIKWDWVILALTASGMIKKEMICGIPQGSVFGPLLWTTASDDILKKEVKSGLSIICYTDDTLVVTVEDNIPMLEREVNTNLEVTTHWT